MIKTYELKFDYMSQKDCCEISVRTKAQQLSRDHWDHQHGFNKVKQTKMMGKKLSISASLPAESLKQ